MTRKRDDGYGDCVRPPTPSGNKPTPKDVRVYHNSGNKVLLCLSCAAKRRKSGKTVELESGGLVSNPCDDCAPPPDESAQLELDL
jgi:hypothetical protein